MHAKRFALWAASFVWMAFARSASPEAQPLKYHAIVIGISDYMDVEGNGWRDLNTAAKDALAIGDILEKSYGFTVTRLVDAAATRTAMVAALDRISVMGPQDACLVYFAGHGSYSKQKNLGFWIPHDARATDGDRDPIEDWVWNSMLTQVLDNSSARHILIISDSCYSGSLFRGDGLPTPPVDPMYHYHRRAIQLPARQLLTSGGLEPVPDGGAVHSKFAQQILHFLNDPAHIVFAASELGAAVCPRVSSLTGTLPRFGTIDLGAHGGGDFIFSRAQVALPAGQAPDLIQNRTRANRAEDAFVLRDNGWLHGAQQVGLNTLETQSLRGEIGEMLHALNRDIQEQKTRSKPSTPGAGAWVFLPFKVDAEDEEAVRATALFRERLARALRAGGKEVVNRVDLADILQEHQLSSSDLTDSAHKLEVGKLLPAAKMLNARILPDGDHLLAFLAVTDTATSGLRLLNEIDMKSANLEEIVRLLTAEK